MILIAILATETDCRQGVILKMNVTDRQMNVSRVRRASHAPHTHDSPVLHRRKCVAWIPHRALANLISFALNSRSTHKLDAMPS